MIILRALAAPLAAILLATPALAITATGGSISSAARVTFAGLEDSKTDTDTAAGFPALLSASSMAVVVSSGTFATAASSNRATWSSATQGSVALDWVWNLTNTTGSTGLTWDTRPPNMDSWVYSFTTGDQRAIFSADWTLEVFGQTTEGLQGIYGGGGLPLFITPFTFSPTDSTGSFTVDLDPNTDYSFTVFNFGNVVTLANLATERGAFFTMFWEITTVPEPRTWGLMIAGFGMVGAAVRRRRVAAA
jgi:hypothetical protein